MDTTYEELGCVGYQPQLRKLEAVVYVKKHFGYGGDLCSPGSPEYVRFYLSYDNGATWVDQGLVNFTAWNMPFNGNRLEYAVTLDINPPERFCFTENLPLARAILSWNNPPPPNTPNHHPHWGNVRDARIQIGARRKLIFSELASEFKLKLPEVLDHHRRCGTGAGAQEEGADGKRADCAIQRQGGSAASLPGNRK